MKQTQLDKAIAQLEAERHVLDLAIEKLLKLRHAVKLKPGTVRGNVIHSNTGAGANKEIA